MVFHEPLRVASVAVALLVAGDMDHTTVEAADLVEVAEGVHLGELVTGERATVTYWRIDPGASLPVHEHEQEQIGYVLRGRLTAISEGEEVRLEAGDSYRFPSWERHGAENRSEAPAVGLGYLSPPREAPGWRTR